MPGSLAEMLTDRDDLESDSEDDELLTPYREEPAISVPTVIEALSNKETLRRSTSSLSMSIRSNHFATSTRRPGYIAPPSPSFTFHREEDVPSLLRNIAAPNSPLPPLPPT